MRRYPTLEAFERFETSDGFVMASQRGLVRVSVLGPQVVRLDLERHAHADFAEPTQEVLDRVAASGNGPLFMAVDAEGMTSYDSRFRYLWTEWLKRNINNIECVSGLFRNGLIEAGVIVINAVTGLNLIQRCRTRDDFEDRLDEAYQRARRSIA